MTAIFLSLAIFLTACTGPGSLQSPGSQSSRGGASAPRGHDGEGPLNPPHMNGREPVRVAILLPLSGQNRDAQGVAQALLDAAQLALFDESNPDLLLIPKDTMGTTSGAATAADAAIAEGAEIILGPLFATSVEAVAPVAQASGVPVVAFSTDREVARPGIYLLSFLPEYEVERITDYAVSQGMMRFAAMIPSTRYGDRVLASFQSSVTDRFGSIIQMERYSQTVDAMFEPARRLAQIPDFQAVLLPEGGTNLRGLAPLLPYFDVDPRVVKFLGTGLWDDRDVGREPTLVGGWFAAPPPDARAAFAERFNASFGRNPPRIASLGYDAVGLAAVLARSGRREGRFSEDALTNPNGFTGIDGIFRFMPDGSTERGLAVIEVKQDGFEVISPAPSTFQRSSF